MNKRNKDPDLIDLCINPYQWEVQPFMGSDQSSNDSSSEGVRSRRSSFASGDRSANQHGKTICGPTSEDSGGHDSRVHDSGFDQSNNTIYHDLTTITENGDRAIPTTPFGVPLSTTTNNNTPSRKLKLPANAKKKTFYCKNVKRQIIQFLKTRYKQRCKPLIEHLKKHKVNNEQTFSRALKTLGDEGIAILKRADLEEYGRSRKKQWCTDKIQAVRNHIDNKVILALKNTNELPEEYLEDGQKVKPKWRTRMISKPKNQ